MQLDLSPLTIDTFLAEYWQQKPVIIKAGLKDFEEPLTPDELAGLATEKHIESRLIAFQNDQWVSNDGPFEDFEDYGDSHWSLVVQSVNHWVPAADHFARLFDFIPQWRFDDVMVSFAAPQGGVGPHVDNYDVFICQGLGSRHWRVGEYQQFETIQPTAQLLHVKPFTAMIDAVLNTGDILYIPPGFPHEGISREPSMSFSVGYKSTNSNELMSGLADFLLDFQTPKLLQDRKRQVSHYASIDHNDFSRLKTFLKQTTNDDELLSDFIGQYYSQSIHELDMVGENQNFDTWLSQFEQEPLYKLPALKTIYLEQNIHKHVFYMDGTRQQLNSTQPEMIRYLCDKNIITMKDLTPPDPQILLEWLWQNTNRGYWYFDNE